MATGEKTDEKKKIRIWCDGCYDMCHFGHANSFRQAKAMGDYLVVGVHSDDEVKKNKGPPVMTDRERYRMVRAVKWVDEVVEDAPYVPGLEILDKNNCDFCVHGDDISTDADGLDAYRLVKEAGRFKECQRTAGISTTDIVNRLLRIAEENEGRPFGKDSPMDEIDTKQLGLFIQNPFSSHAWTGVSHFLPTSQKILQFASGAEPKKGDKIIYVDGSFDLFHILFEIKSPYCALYVIPVLDLTSPATHCGHIDFLEKAKKKGDFLIAGIYPDHVINYYKGGGKWPIMTLHERVLSVLACRYVDEVVIGAPYVVSKEVIDHFKIDAVVHGKTPLVLDEKGNHPYKVGIVSCATDPMPFKLIKTPLPCHIYLFSNQFTVHAIQVCLTQNLNCGLN
eukprot:m.48167 g.48167  ORF g.48167 m.48167 type:complete len:393 (+) comp33854_c0_seq26:74-1252(+)